MIIVNISAKLLDNENTMLFLILLYILLPSSIATTIVEKESSINTISEADFVTSVPVIPIPTPT